jgi:hypothetical protein
MSKNSKNNNNQKQQQYVNKELDEKGVAEVEKSIEADKAEKTIENEILNALNQLPMCFAFKINTIGVYDPVIGNYRTLSKFVLPGTSDILCCIQGKFVAIEVKDSSGTLSQAQLTFLGKVERCGGAAITARTAQDAVERVKIFAERGVSISS